MLSVCTEFVLSIPGVYWTEMDIRREILPDTYTYTINKSNDEDEVVIRVKEVTDEASARVS